MERDMVMPGEMGERLPLVAAAKFVGDDLSPHTLRAWARQGKVSYYRCGRRIYFAKSDLEVLLRRSRIEARGA